MKLIYNENKPNTDWIAPIATSTLQVYLAAIPIGMFSFYVNTQVVM